jgi:hypothetical protein
MPLAMVHCVHVDGHWVYGSRSVAYNLISQKLVCLGISSAKKCPAWRGVT